MVHFELGNDFLLKLRSFGFRKNSESHEEVNLISASPLSLRDSLQ